MLEITSSITEVVQILHFISSHYLYLNGILVSLPHVGPFRHTCCLESLLSVALQPLYLDERGKMNPFQIQQDVQVMHQLMEKAAIQNLGMDYSVMTRLLEQLRQCQLSIVQPRSSASTLHFPLWLKGPLDLSVKDIETVLKYAKPRSNRAGSNKKLKLKQPSQ